MYKAGLIFLFFIGAYIQTAAQAGKKIIFITAPNNHSKGEHEYKAGCHLLAKLLSENMPGVSTQVFDNGWPEDSSLFNKASSIVLYCNGGERHLLLAHLEEMNRLMKKGIGLIALHNAIEAPKEKAGAYFLNWLRGYFETWYSVNPRWKASLAYIPGHEITNGVKPFSIKDEWYYHIRFADSLQNVATILQAVPPASSLQENNGPYKGNALVRKAIADRELQTLMWAYDRPGGGRSIGFTGAHYFMNWRNENFRKLVLNAIAWTAGIKIPAAGVYSPKPSRRELNALKD